MLTLKLARTHLSSVRSRPLSNFLLSKRVGPKTILEVDLSTIGLVDRVATSNNPFRAPLVLGNVLTALFDAAHNPNIVGVSFGLGLKPIPIVHVQELREVIKAFRKHNKATFVHSECYTNWNYYLASAFEHIWMIPEGIVQLRNLNHMPQLYFGHVISQSGIEIPVIRKKDYKLALSNLTDEAMSDNARDELQRLYLDGIWAQCKRDMVLDNRFQNEEQIQNLVDQGYAYGGTLVESRIVDEFLHSTKAKEKMLRAVGLPEHVISSPKARSGHLINLSSYSKQLRKKQASHVSPSLLKRFFIRKPSIVGVVTLTGAIGSGSSKEGISSQYAEKLIRQAAANEQVKSIVLRVDSGGGSVLASSVIGDAIQETIKSGKPVVASMSTVAGSGGYWISSPCSAILASPATFTGSIGVLIPSLRLHQLLTKKLGLTVDYGPGKPTPSSNLDSFIAPYTDQHREIQDRFAEHFYQIFLSWVSKTRKLDITTVEAIAKGKVYTGEAAFALKLVDELGGFIPALQLASKLGGVPLQDNSLPLTKNFPTGSPMEVLKYLFGKQQPRNSEDLSVHQEDIEALLTEYISSSLTLNSLKDISALFGIDYERLKELGCNGSPSLPSIRQNVPFEV